jgi:hypothetical protein
VSYLTAMNCPVCFIEYAIPKALADKRRAEGGYWFCPNGHNLHFSPSEIDTLRAERDRLKQNAAYLEDRNRQLTEARNAAERQASAAKGRVTHLKNRAAAGVCPCCNRTFINLQRHMATKHAGFTVEEVQAEHGQTVQ